MLKCTTLPTERLRHAQMLRAEAEKAAEALREELERTRRAATERAAEDAAAHEAAVARLTAEHDRARVHSLTHSCIGSSLGDVLLWSMEDRDPNMLSYTPAVQSAALQSLRKSSTSIMRS